MHVGRDYRIPISLSKEEIPFMVSPAYDVFEIIDTTILLPEYLMMWFSRKEFDRNTWFHTDADVRGGLPWSAFCDLELPIPSLEKQREIVKEYNTIQNRIALNNQLISKLEETAQAIYKQWFVDFEFPNENAKPYKSSDGKMVWCEELEKEIPEGWELTELKNIIEVEPSIKAPLSN
jgi:type I restriction enzyme S subunit